MRKIWLQNAEALIRQEYQPVMEMVVEYEAGKHPAEFLKDKELAQQIRGHGTRIEAVVQYIKATYKVKPKKKPKPA